MSGLGGCMQGRHGTVTPEDWLLAYLKEEVKEGI